VKYFNKKTLFANTVFVTAAIIANTFFFNVNALAEVRANNRQLGLLWRIEKPGLAPSYLFGTIHLNDERVKNLAPPIKTAFRNSRSFTMEMIADTNGLAAMSKIMFLNGGLSLRKITGEALYQDTVRVLLKRGMTTENLDRIKPWVVIMMLSTPRSKTGLFLDMDLYMQATMLKIPRYGLETMAEQLAPFNNITIREQVALLKDSLASLEDFDKQLEEITSAYLQRDLTALLAISENYQGQAGKTYRALMNTLIKERNVRMRTRMQPRLLEGNAFIAVGALHLPGENGLIKLLEKQGYTLTSVY
jgi:uncharacterized protein YbaP (TraB family)